MSWYDEISEIRRLAGIPLEEAAPSVKRLLPMFDNVLQLLPNTKNIIEQEVKWAREALEREDRVIWYLRFLQLSILAKASEEDSAIGQAVDKKIQQMSKKSGASVGEIKSSLSMFMDGSVKRYLTHFLSMPIAGVQQYTFGWQTASKIYDDFKQLEEDWREDQERTVEPDPEAEVVIDFGDGYAWYNLNKAYCSREANAMGHCGNAPRQRSTDTILSLRRQQKVGDEVVLTPVLTFILDYNGLLGEMKGRGNDKPAERYHKYIIPLLLHDIVNGIKGGGYLPEHNFRLSDLDEDVVEELIEKKPELQGPVHLIRKLIDAKQYEEAESSIKDVLDEHGLEYYIFEVDWESGDVFLKDWKDFEQVANDYNDEAVQSLFNVLDDLNAIETSSEQVEDSLLRRDILIEIISRLPSREQRTLVRGMEQGDLNGGPDDMDKIERSADLIIREGVSNRYYHYLIDAAESILAEVDQTETVNALKEDVENRLKEYADAGYSLSPYIFWAGPKKPKDDPESWKGEWAIHATIREILDIIEAGIEGDEYGGDEYSYYYHEWRDPDKSLWPDSDNLNELREQDNLSRWDEKDELAENIADKHLDLNVEKYLPSIVGEFAMMLRTLENKKRNDIENILEECIARDFQQILTRAGL